MLDHAAECKEARRALYLSVLGYGRAEKLDPGWKTTMECPLCHGGYGNDKGKNTLGVYRVKREDLNGIFYRCYRATCAFNGYSGLIRTGKCVMPRMKLLGLRWTSPTCSILWKRLRISSHNTRSCSSASRLPMQRCMPKPKLT